MAEMNELETEVRNFETDPVAFIKIFMDRALSKKQELFLRSTLSSKHIVNIWARQTGKSTIMASYILWRLLYGKGMTIEGEHLNEQIAIVAPIKDQHVLIYEKIRTLMDKNEYVQNFITKINSETIQMINGNFCRFMSASPGSHIRGFTATCIIIDESQDILDHKYNADILPFGTITNALIIESGTPKTKNHFYRAMHNKSITLIKQYWFECPFLSKEYVMHQKSNSPDALWRQEYLCEFVEEGVLAFPSWLFEPEMKDNKITKRWNLSDYNYIEKKEELTKDYIQKIQTLHEQDATFVAGLDLGKEKDNTVYSILRTDIRPIQLMVKLKFPLKTSFTHIAEVIVMFYKVFQHYDFNIDYTNESSFIEILKDKGLAIYGDKYKNRGLIRFNNKNKGEMINNARILLEQFQLNLPKKAESLISQFLNQQYEVNAQNQYIYFHPSGEHDDELWSVLLALKNITLLSVEEITTFVNPWEKNFDEVIHSAVAPKTKELLLINKSRKERRMKDRYIPAAMRRMR